jgi:hypothetical protein
MTQTGVRTNIFGIGEVYELQREGQWVERNRESYREFGYFGGGLGPSTTVDRIDYSNDTSTASVRGPLSLSRFALAATGNSNFGYFTGGFASGFPPFSRVDRIDYSNDSATASVRGPLNLRVNRQSACGNSNFGYFGGGDPGPVSTISRIDYNNDTNTSIDRGLLTISRINPLSTSNLTFGWFAGGTLPGAGVLYSRVDRINYSNDLILSSIRGNLSASKSLSSSSGNSNFGYFGAGFGSSNTDRIDYSNDTATAITRGRIVNRLDHAATGNSNFGYFGAGRTISTVDRIDYSNDTQISSVRGPLTSARRYLAATSSSSFGGAPVSYLGAPWVATAPYGYFGGGRLNPSAVHASTIDRIDYSNDTSSASVRGPLSITRHGISATGNSNFGYFGGGLLAVSTVVSTVDRVDYSNDSAAASTRGPLSISKVYFGATGNSNFGYFGGGSTDATAPGAVSTIDRIDYSNDSATASSRGFLIQTRRSLSATGTSNFGYFSGGGESISNVNRLDYSNDLVNTTVRGPLSVARQVLGGTGNNNFGYYGAGIVPSPTAIYSIVDRINYSNDTSTALIRGPLSLARYTLAATGNSNSGYFGGGYTPTLLSLVDRIDYSNDTQVASIRGSLSLARNLVSASSSQAFGGAPNTSIDPLPAYIRDATKYNDSNTLDLPFKRVLGSFGYFGGGAPAVSRVDRIDYSNDTTTASVRGPLAATSYDMYGISNKNFSYFGGRLTTFNKIDYSNDINICLLRGSCPSISSASAVGTDNFGYFGSGNVFRIDYSNDNSSSSLRSSGAIFQSAATGNSNFGYFGGGASVTFLSTVKRLNFSNDTSNLLQRSPLSLARNTLKSTGNSNFGYFGGGQIVPNIMYSRVDRIDYSNDTTTASVRGPLSLARRELAATGNSNFGYFGAGTFPVVFSIVDRIDYSNDTVTASVRGPLSLARRNLAATTNARSS